MEKGSKKKVKASKGTTAVCPACGYENCRCEQMKKAKIKKTRHDFKR